MEQRGKITVQFDERGELDFVDLGEGELREPTHSLVDKVPPGILKGIADMGKIYTYELPDGKLTWCVHLRCKLF